MTRALVATEGPTDEVVAAKLIHFVSDTVQSEAVQIDYKQFPSRGYQVVRRLVSTVTKAAHFGYYELLVVHFDLDGMVIYDQVSDVPKCPRWQEMDGVVREVLSKARNIPRVWPVRVALMTPCRATDAWLMWGKNGGDGHHWEKQNPHNLKIELYGNPPRGLKDKVVPLADELVRRMQASNDWPVTLRFFVEQVQAGLVSNRIE